MPRFKLLVGGHTETLPNGQTVSYKKLPKGPDVVFDSPLPLDKIFGKEKFERFAAGVPEVTAPDEVTEPRATVAAASAPSPSPAPEKDAKDKTAPAVTSSALGDDVTDLFPGAEKAGLHVFLKGDVHFVTDNDRPDKPLKKGNGIDAKAVKKLILALSD